MAEKFDKNEAGALILLYDGKNDIIKRIIEPIVMMNSMLKEPNNKKLLILFVLQTRINKNERMKFNQKYDIITQLICDIKKYLLPKSQQFL